jgi:hypothetical protein
MGMLWSRDKEVRCAREGYDGDYGRGLVRLEQAVGGLAERTHICRGGDEHISTDSVAC